MDQDLVGIILSDIKVSSHCSISWSWKDTLPQKLYDLQDNNLVSCPMRSECIHSTYFIKVWTIFLESPYSQPSIYVPIDIQYPEMQSQPLNTPTDWNPQVFDVNNAVFIWKDKKNKKLVPYDEKIDPILSFRQIGQTQKHESFTI